MKDNNNESMKWLKENDYRHWFYKYYWWIPHAISAISVMIGAISLIFVLVLMNIG